MYNIRGLACDPADCYKGCSCVRPSSSGTEPDPIFIPTSPTDDPTEAERRRQANPNAAATVAYPAPPVRILDAIRLVDSGAAQHVRWEKCLRDDPAPGRWLEESLRALRSGGQLDLLLLPDARGENVSASWLLCWLDKLASYRMERRADGAIVVQGRKG